MPVSLASICANWRDHSALASECLQSRRALVLLALDIQHLALQRQGEGDVGDFVESQPGHGMLQGGNRGDGPAWPPRRRSA